jgi:hypothetical protein
MLVTPSLNPLLEGKSIRFQGADLTGQPANYRMAIKTPEIAADLAEKIQKEVEEMKRESE